MASSARKVVSAPHSWTTVGDRNYFHQDHLLTILLALRILLQVTRQIRRLDISHNLLGRPGARTLLNGLSTLRSRYSSPELGLWGLKEMNLGCNALDDAALDAAMAYVKKDVCMRKLLVQANEIEVRWPFLVREMRLYSLSAQHWSGLLMTAVTR
jgi:hypothetical protein